MRKRFYKIIVACFLLTINAVAYGQGQPKNSPLITVATAASIRQGYQKQLQYPLRNFYAKPLIPLSAQRPPVLTTSLKPDAYTRHFGFFCRKELQFEKTTGIPLKFRLGSLASSSALEGK